MYLLPDRCQSKTVHSGAYAARDHRQSVPHQGVVGIIPFRTLGVQPDATFVYIIAEFRQERKQQFSARVV